MKYLTKLISFSFHHVTVRHFIRRRWIEISLVANGYSEDRVPRLAAALSYYTVFSLAPLLVIAVAVAGLGFGDEAARGNLAGQFKSLIGDEGASAVQTMIDNSKNAQSSILATIIGLLTLLIGAAGVFGELQDSLNSIWKVQARPGGTIRGMIRSRLLSFAMVFGIGFLLLVSLILSAVLAAVGSWLNSIGFGLGDASRIIDALISFLVISVLFAGSFKLLPDLAVRWRDVWIGSLLTSLLFVVGKFLIGLYLGKSAVGSTYGSMGALAVLLIWIYYSSQIFFIGVEFTRAHALTSGSKLSPIRNAEWIPGHDADQEIHVIQDRMAL